MTPQEQAQLLKKEVNTILEKWKIKDPVFHERLLCKDICLKIIEVNKDYCYTSHISYWNEVKKILEDET